MAEINLPDTGKQPGVRRSKKLSTRVDLTPMVDLGFLLITFFIFTTNMQKPMALKLILPADGTGTAVGESSSLTVIPLGGDSLFFYYGSPELAHSEGAYGYADYSVVNGLGQIIRSKQKAMEMVGLKRTELTLLIKPAKRSSYSHFVDILDEIKINDVKHYAVMDLSTEEARLFALGELRPGE